MNEGFEIGEWVECRKVIPSQHPAGGEVWVQGQVEGSAFGKIVVSMGPLKALERPLERFDREDVRKLRN